MEPVEHSVNGRTFEIRSAIEATTDGDLIKFKVFEGNVVLPNLDPIVMVEAESDSRTQNGISLVAIIIDRLKDQLDRLDNDPTD